MRMSSSVRSVLAVAVIAGVALAPAAAAGGDVLPRLPADRVVRDDSGGPGKVTFSHRSHVDVKKPACTGCHPAQFRILQASVRPGGDITHASMEAGRQCGACHDGKASFGLDQCALCHRQE